MVTHTTAVNSDATKIYRYMNFDQLPEYVERAKEVTAWLLRRGHAVKR